MSIHGKLNDLINRRYAIEQLGGADAVKQHKADGKMTSRERIEALLDENSFVEIGAFVTQRSTDFIWMPKTCRPTESLPVMVQSKADWFISTARTQQSLVVHWVKCMPVKSFRFTIWL